MEPLYNTDTLRTTKSSVLIYSRDNIKCSDKRGVLISEVVLYSSLCSWDSRRCPHYLEVLCREVPLYCFMESLLPGRVHRGG